MFQSLSWDKQLIRVYPNPNGRRYFEKDIHGIRKVPEKRYIVLMDQYIPAKHINVFESF